MPNRKIQIYIAEPDQILPEALNLLNPHADLIIGNPSFSQNLSPHVEGVVIRSAAHIDRYVLEKFPRLSFIIRIGVGLDIIDTKLCQERGIKIYNSAGSNANAVSEYVVGMTLMAARKWNLLTSQDVLDWHRFKFLGSEIRGKTIGIIGFGHIGRLVYQKLVSWGCSFLVYDPYIDTHSTHYFSLNFSESLEFVLSESDIVTLHLPLNSTTHHLLNRNNLEHMKPNSILINTARGGIVDEQAVMDVFLPKEGIYVADVFENEPLVNKKLIDHPQVITTPHIAAMTETANQAMAFEAIEKYLEDYNQSSKGSDHESYQPGFYRR